MFLPVIAALSVVGLFDSSINTGVVATGTTAATCAQLGVSDYAEVSTSTGNTAICLPDCNTMSKGAIMGIENTTGSVLSDLQIFASPGSGDSILTSTGTSSVANLVGLSSAPTFLRFECLANNYWLVTAN